MNYNFIKNEIIKFNNIAREFDLPKLYIVGGLCRDVVFSGGNFESIQDVDLTCCDGAKSTILGMLIGRELGAKISYFNNHCSIFYNGIKYDFSSGYIDDAAKDNTDRFEREILSRDFTLDSLLLDIDDDRIIDLTKRGVKDIEAGIIRTIISPKVTFMSDPKRVLRAIEMSTRFGFKIEQESIDYIVENYDFFNKYHNENRSHSLNMIDKSMNNSEKSTLEALIKTRVLYQIPLSGKFKDILIKYNLIEKYLDNQITISSAV